MAVTPLFSTREALLNRIRMATTQDAQTLAVVDMAITDVRVGFYGVLGNARTLAIAAYASSENPVTDEEIKKATAALAEALWITALLVDTLPAMFLENAAKVRDEFNDEPLTRDAGAIARYKNSLMSRVNKMLGMLQDPTVSGGDFQCFSTGAVDEDGQSAPYLLRDNFIGKGI